jgi:hypothetical protein
LQLRELQEGVARGTENGGSVALCKSQIHVTSKSAQYLVQ